MEYPNDNKPTAGTMQEEWEKLQASIKAEEKPKGKYLEEIDRVRHPVYYNTDCPVIKVGVGENKSTVQIECIDVIRDMPTWKGNAIKYLWRAGLKTELGIPNKEKEIEDLRKAIFYIEDKIRMLENE